VTGGIAAYKICSLVSSLRKADNEVHVLMTKEAQAFVGALTFQTLSNQRVITDMFSIDFQPDVHHISLAKKADLFVIAPATANVIAKVANGIADDMLTTTFLAAECPKVIVPAMNTHMLENPEQYITRVGKFIRKTSIDELPQMYQVFVGKLSCVGPRPALWNQTDLWEEREKYGANDIKPGITGWAQINGRDELEIPVKAKFDGDYAAALNEGKFKGIAMDLRCLFGTIKSVLRSDGVVEGGTGEMKKKEEKEELISE
jgi:hypothetical protein